MGDVPIQITAVCIHSFNFELIFEGLLLADFQIDAWNSRSGAKQMKSVSSSYHSGRACEKAHLRNSKVGKGDQNRKIVGEAVCYFM